MLVQHLITQGENMRSAYSEDFCEVVELCCDLMALVQNAFVSETREGGSILAYTGICKCASRIRSAAEKRRDTIALSKLAQLLVHDRDLTEKGAEDLPRGLH